MDAYYQDWRRLPGIPPATQEFRQGHLRAPMPQMPRFFSQELDNHDMASGALNQRNHPMAGYPMLSSLGNPVDTRIEYRPEPEVARQQHMGLQRMQQTAHEMNQRKRAVRPGEDMRRPQDPGLMYMNSDLLMDGMPDLGGGIDVQGAVDAKAPDDRANRMKRSRKDVGKPQQQQQQQQQSQEVKTPRKPVKAPRQESETNQYKEWADLLRGKQGKSYAVEENRLLLLFMFTGLQHNTRWSMKEALEEVSLRARVSTRTLKQLLKKWKESKQVPLPERGKGSLKDMERKRRSTPNKEEEGSAMKLKKGNTLNGGGTGSSSTGVGEEKLMGSDHKLSGVPTTSERDEDEEEDESDDEDEEDDEEDDLDK